MLNHENRDLDEDCPGCGGAGDYRRPRSVAVVAMSDIIDRLKERCWPLDRRDELCMDAVYVITDLRERLAAAESKEVCTVAHSDEVLEFCPYCKIEGLRARLEGYEFLLSDPGAKSLYWAAVAVANAIHAGLGPMIKGTDMERDLRDVLWLRDGELRDVPRKTTTDGDSAGVSP